MVDRGWLEQQLEAGRSMEAIAREVGKNASTVAYWVNKHGLVSPHAERHQGKGPIAEAVLRELVEQGLSVRQIAAELDRSFTTIRYWLRKCGLRTQPLTYTPAGDRRPDSVMRNCPTHGWTVHVRDAQGSVRCPTCRSSRVVTHRRAVKAQLVAEAGGACVLCGYDRCLAALQFHHLDPEQKSFSLSRQGRTISLERARAEASKCVLLCGNCHVEVEAGVAQLTLRDASRPLRGSSTDPG